MIIKIISGGQTGVDRAGLDTAKEFGIITSSYCPEGYLAENNNSLSIRSCTFTIRIF